MLTMLTIVGWLWRNERAAAKYTVDHANVWARMIHRHLTLPHRFVLMTDQPQAPYDPLIEAVPLWDDWRALKNKNWADSKPHCYVRLKAFSKEAREIFGERFVSIDLDLLALRPLDPLFDRPDDFLILRRAVATRVDLANTYNGSMWMMNAGARSFVWEDFKGEESIRLAAKFLGTDQAWMRYRLGPNERGWSAEDGVYGWPRIRNDSRYRVKPPENARIIFFYGGQKPWNAIKQPSGPAPVSIWRRHPRPAPQYPPEPAYGWVAEAYR